MRPAWGHGREVQPGRGLAAAWSHGNRTVASWSPQRWSQAQFVGTSTLAETHTYDTLSEVLSGCQGQSPSP